MKATAYLRIAKTERGVGFGATSKPNHNPLQDGRGNTLPTVCVKLVLDLPADFFDPAVAVLHALVPKNAPELAMEIKP